MSIKVTRKQIVFNGDPRRVITRFFMPSPESRIVSILKKVKDMPVHAATLVLNQTLRDFSGRHRNVSRIFRKHFERARLLLRNPGFDMLQLPEAKQLLLGAYFTSEYSIESAAFFNPSVVEDPDQSGLRAGQKRVVFSFRATGEGHVSSIVFRGGILDEFNNLEVIPTARLVEEADMVVDRKYNLEALVLEVQQKQLDIAATRNVISKLNREFDYYELHEAIDKELRHAPLPEDEKRILGKVRSLSDTSYEITFSLDTGISDRVIFPITPDERNGIEDARFVRFTGDDGLVSYYATYTAYNGKDIMPRLIQTRDFYKFNIIPIHGKNVHNKGIALFPHKIRGKYAMLARMDGVNNYVMYSEDMNVWGEDKHLIQEPTYPWEFIQVGNCGSPIATPQGWLVITHGVGTMRRYCLGAMLLDLDHPEKVIGALSEPLMVPSEQEREGYVPNVVYSCGALINGEELVIPYAMSDTCSSYATVNLAELMHLLLPVHVPARGKRQSKGHILLVDDETVSLEILAHYLKQEGYEVDMAPDGIVALMKIDKIKFDLIISDIAMPNFDGYQLLAYLSMNASRIPVILLTGSVDLTDKERGLDLGAAAYLQKPVDKVQLLDHVTKIMKTIKVGASR
ncbi:MAG: response regulator [Chitinophaga sp.]|uniref:glycoside hydrolase family 130 protein n=1 Tax=Chitinophaga sp. TaxID=1869181 RepID=UPI0025BE70C8|nr:response regulator [Chitinophaga sp.]MBV8252994.1 response regulator [Chitinophaga sp.]